MNNSLHIGMEGLHLSKEDSSFYSCPAYDARCIRKITSSSAEVVDYSFNYKGELSIWFVFFLGVSLFSIFIYGVTIFRMIEGVDEKYSYLIVVVSTIAGVLATTMVSYITWVLFSIELRRPALAPVIFNRKLRTVFFFECTESRSIDWSEIIFKIHPAMSFGIPHKNIIAYRNDDQGELKQLFVLGWMEDTDKTLSYWEFIRSYMEDDVVEDLAGIIEFCPDMKETFIGGFQTLIRFSGRSSWIWLPVSAPYYFVAAVFRWLLMRFGRKAQWTPEIEALCAPDPDDPIHVDAAINPKDRWGFAFMDLSSSYYQQRDQRIADAHARIAEKLSQKYV